MDTKDETSHANKIEERKLNTMFNENESFETPKFGEQMNADEAVDFEMSPSEPEAPVYAVPAKKQRKVRAKRTHRAGARIVALALCCALLGGAVGAGGIALLNNNKTEAAPAKTTTVVEGQRSAVSVAKTDTSAQMSAADVYEANVNSTVGITTSVTTTNFWGYQTQAAASGSGFIISDDGYILTNHHVIEDANAITVTMYNGDTYDADLVGYDESNDIAVLKIEAKDLTPVILGDSDELRVGDSVVAIGNPLGELTFSLTAGCVSALDRRITMSNGLSMELIQTDCAINSGNSGGALFNLYGEVIGITNAKYSGDGGSTASIDNIGFAIPVNNILNIVKSIIEKGYISKPYIGVTVGDVGEEAQGYGMPKGASIRSVVENGPAAKAGVQAGDIVTAANGQEITCGDDLVKIVSGLNVGDELELTVYRKNETVSIKVTIEEKIQQAKADEEQSGRDGQSQATPQDGQQQGESQMPEGWDQYSEDWGQYSEGEQQMPEGWDQYSEGEQQMPEGWDQYGGSQQMPQQGQGYGSFDPFSYFFGN